MKIYYDNQGLIAPEGIELDNYIEVDVLPNFDKDNFEYLLVDNGEVLVKVCEEALVHKKLNESRAYLSSTDWYYARKIEAGEEVPEDVVTKRVEARAFVRANELH